MESAEFLSNNRIQKSIKANYAIKTLQVKWSSLSLEYKQKEFNKLYIEHYSEQKSEIKMNKSLSYNQRSEEASNGKSSQYLDENQNMLVSLKAELGWEYLKNQPDFINHKYFLCLPTLSKSDKAFIGRKITENKGIIKSSLSDVDFIVVNEGVFDGEDAYKKQEQIKIFNHMNATMSQEEKMSQQPDISKSINFIHGGNYMSRIAKLVTQAPKINKLELESTKSSSEIAGAKLKFNDVFNFLSNPKWKVLTLNDLYDVINRQESIKQNQDWFRKRLKPVIKEYGEFNYKSLFCVASFYRLTDGSNREMDHICHYHEFDLMVSSPKVEEKHFEFLRQNNPKMHMFKCLKVAVPLVNLEAPQGTAIFQTYFEYNYGKFNWLYF